MLVLLCLAGVTSNRLLAFVCFTGTLSNEIDVHIIG
jgi:hypothetical protein